MIALSLLLYNVTRNMSDRVARASGVLLACVAGAYVCDVFISLGPGAGTYEIMLRLQWLAIAFMPAAMFHLSDALLATTGLPSRGRRRRVVRVMYLISATFALLAGLTDTVIYRISAPVVTPVTMTAGGVFIIYVAFFTVAVVVSLINVQRARNRCLTRSTRRRMGYLLLAMLTPPLGIFPFSLLLPPGEVYTLPALWIVNLTNIVVVLLLLFLAYPLSFFGSAKPDRMVKAELLRFILRGPGTGLLALVLILLLSPTTRIFGIPGESFTAFAVVGAVLVWQWGVHLSLPWLEQKLIYGGEDGDQFAKLQDLSERLLTPADLLQLTEANLAAACDYLRVNSAFIAVFDDAQTLDVIATIGPERPALDWLVAQTRKQNGKLAELDPAVIQEWLPYWVLPLQSEREDYALPGQKRLLGFMGIRARAPQFDLSEDEQQIFVRTFARRAAEVLDDMQLQGEIVAALEGLLPQITLTRSRAADVEYRPGHAGVVVEPDTPDREPIIEQTRAALRHYWGGPGLSSSRLIELGVVQDLLADNDNNPSRALRALLQKAIDQQKPDGAPRMTSPEWTIYNILNLRFIERIKVRDVAIRLALSEPDLYRKQRAAIEAVADTIIAMESERSAAAEQSTPA